MTLSPALRTQSLSHRLRHFHPKTALLQHLASATLDLHLARISTATSKTTPPPLLISTPPDQVTDQAFASVKIYIPYVASCSAQVLSAAV